MDKTILTAYTLLFALRFLFHWVLTVLNVNSALSAGEEVPPFAQSWIDGKGYRRIKEYTKKKGDFGLIRFAFHSLFLLILLYGAIPGRLDRWLVSLLPSNPILSGILFFMVMSLIMDGVEIPFDVYGQFILEEEFGFNRMSGALWLTDKIKGGLVSLIIGFPLLALLFLFMDRAGAYWWLYAWLAFSLFQIVMTLVYPVFIAPLFNKFTPLEEGELKNRLEDLAEECGFETRGIFMMDGSKRSGHSNAYFTGLGKAKRIVLYDTLVEKLSVDELAAVLAHEIGHFKMKHIRKRLLSSLASTLIVFFLISQALGWAPLFRAFSFDGPSYHAILFILMFFSSPFTYFLTPLLSRISRSHEYQADRFARDVMKGPEALQNGLAKLNRDNLSHLTPHRLYSSFYYSHPPLKERWEALEED